MPQVLFWYFLGTDTQAELAGADGSVAQEQSPPIDLAFTKCFVALKELEICRHLI